MLDAEQHFLDHARAGFAGEIGERRLALEFALRPCAASDAPCPASPNTRSACTAMRSSRSALSVSSTVSGSFAALRRASVRFGTTSAKISSSL